jgi:hypothetical protein
MATAATAAATTSERTAFRINTNLQSAGDRKACSVRYWYSYLGCHINAAFFAYADQISWQLLRHPLRGHTSSSG